MIDKYVWIIRFCGEGDITVFGSKEAVYKYGMEALEDEKWRYENEEAYAEAVKEFKETFDEYDGQFEVDDFFYCDKEKVWE